MENLGKKTGTTDISTTNRIQRVEERVSGTEYMTDTSVKENVKCKTIHDIKHAESLGLCERPNIRIIALKGEDSQLKVPDNIVNKFIEENFPNLKKLMPIHVQEASRAPNRLD
jgi:hypothetical protein